jgi:dihydrolipoamide dehydrogenase
MKENTINNPLVSVIIPCYNVSSYVEEGIGSIVNQSYKNLEIICIDDYCKTNIDNIYAIGDVNGRAMLAHAASSQGCTVAENLSGSIKRKVDFTLVPSCIYTEPEIASIGLSEAGARAMGLDITMGVFDTAGNGKSVIMGETDGFAKVVADKWTGEILGMQLYGAHATDMIGEGLAAIKLESTLKEIGEAVHPHPTVNEMIMEAVHDAQGKCAHKIKRQEKSI